jgi:hypothetical protein
MPPELKRTSRRSSFLKRTIIEWNNLRRDCKHLRLEFLGCSLDGLEIRQVNCDELGRLASCLLELGDSAFCLGL